MKNYSKIKVFGTMVLTLGFLFSCSDDDDNGVGNNPETASVKIYTSNNADGNITTFDVTDMANVTSSTLITSSTAADGVYYDNSDDSVYQASRSGLALEGFLNVSTLDPGTTVNAEVTGTADMVSPREVAVNGSFYVVADNADVDADTTTPDGRLFIYQKTGTSFTLRNTITTNFKLWGITFIGNDLYAVVDATSDLAVFTNLLSNTADATVDASKRITAEGIVRTHGLTYDAATNTMILTDIGSATDATDGGFHVITDFSTKFSATADGGTLAVGDQIRVAGSSTELGNPVDVAYDGVTGTVFIAEAANGKILAFNNIATGGNLTPAVSTTLTSASAVYLSRN